MDWRNAPVCPPQGVQSAGYPTRLYPETRQAGEAPAGRTDCIRPGAAAQHGRGAVRHIRAGFLTVLIWRTTRPRCPSRSGDPQRGNRWQKGGMGARGGFEELLRKSRPRLAPPVRATPRRGSAPDQSDPALVESRGIGGRCGHPERDGDATRRLDQRIAEQRISALCARPLVRACGEASLARRSLLGAIYRRLCGVLSISRGCTTPPRSSAQTARQVRPYARTDQDQAGRIWPVRAPTREQAQQKAPRNDLFSGVYAVLHAQSEGQLQDWDAHREVTLAAQPDVIVRSDAANTTPADPGTGRRAQSHPPRGHYAYYGVAGNIRALQRVHRFVERYWRKMLCSRSWAGRHLTWAAFNRLKERVPLLRPRLRLPYRALQALVVL